MNYKVGTRGSRLALAQTQTIIERLQEAYKTDCFEIVIIDTKGDRDQHSKLSQIGGSGVFVKEIEKALVAGEIDLAIHSLKDMPVQDGSEMSCIIAGTIERENPFDYVITSVPLDTLKDLPDYTRIGTGSKRRQIELSTYNTTYQYEEIRGNIDTRILKIGQQVDAVVLAQAGIHRLQLHVESPYYFLPLTPEVMVPSPGQGLLGIQIRKDHSNLQQKIIAITNPIAALSAKIERDFLYATEGNCRIPIGGYLELEENGNEIQLTFHGLLGNEKLNQKYKKKKVLGSFIKSELVQIITDFISRNGIISHKRFEIDALNGGYDLGIEMMSQLQQQPKGFVSLVGAGPGDPDLITVKGLSAIQQADIIVYDYLSNPLLLKYAKKEAELIYVGKKAGNHTLTQEAINQLLIDKGQSNQRVVRLKGGDPYVFGRGGEEGAALVEAGIGFEVIPGISSAIGGLAYAGIPVTHRGMATAFHVMTGHLSKTGEAHRYDLLAKLSGTLVFLMGIGQIQDITEQLIANGKPQNTPAAVVFNATLPTQETITGTLETIGKLCQKVSDQPGIIVIGQVVSLGETLDFITKKPLWGKSIVMTQPEAIQQKSGSAREQFIEQLKNAGAQIIEMPLVKIKPLKVEARYFSRQWIQSHGTILFTSPNGVDLFYECLYKQNLDSRVLATLKVVCVGTSTGAALLKKGIVADWIPESFDTQSLAEGLPLGIENVFLRKGMVIFRSAKGSESLITALKALGPVSDIPLYTMEGIAYTDEQKDAIKNVDGFVFTSGSAVEAFDFSLGNQDLLKDKKVYSIGPMTTQSLKNRGWSHIIEAEKHTYVGVLKAILEGGE